MYDNYVKEEDFSFLCNNHLLNEKIINNNELNTVHIINGKRNSENDKCINGNTKKKIYTKCIYTDDKLKGYDGCQLFEPSPKNQEICDNCDHFRDFHEINYINSSLELSSIIEKDDNILLPFSPISPISSPMKSPQPSFHDINDRKTIILLESDDENVIVNTKTNNNNNNNNNNNINNINNNNNINNQNYLNNKIQENFIKNENNNFLKNGDDDITKSIKNYPKIPHHNCPQNLKKKLKKWGFIKRIMIEILISSDNLQWSDITFEIFKKICDSKTVDNITSFFKKSKDIGILNLFHRFSNVNDISCFNIKGNQVIALSASVHLNKIIFEGPFLEQSNRVIREFGPDRFLRVSFNVDDNFHHYHDSYQKVAENVLKYGIKFAGRNYEFLCFSASQLREHKCYFFASSGDDINDNITADTIRSWLGDFSKISSLAKYASRLGQAFSKTFPTIPVPDEHIECIPDIENEEYCWTDGCGEISPEYAQKVSEALDLEEIPSAFQVRFGAIKGVLVINPSIHNKICYRPSMKKYDIPNPTDSQRTIEVIKFSKAVHGYLNRQFIVLLSSLGVPDSYFEKLQDDAIEKLFSLTHLKKSTLSFLNSDSTEDSFKRKALSMILAGHSLDEPFLKTLLKSIQKNLLNQMKEKAKILVPNSKVMLGVCDPFKKLKTGQVFIQISISNGTTIIIKDKIAISKNPCVHPGDFRVLEAVDILELHYIKDCVVFPVDTSGRPHPNEISGSDLDGDQYFVSWDSELVSYITPYPPMNYNQKNLSCIKIPKNSKELIPAIQKYFVNSIFSTALGVIANLHLIHADKYGAKDDLCLELAALHSRAVDAAKTGDFVTIPNYLQNNKKYPHFMEKPPEISYKSNSILGKIYDKVKKKIEDLQVNCYACEPLPLEPDMDLLLDGREKYIKKAKKILKSYKKEISSVLSLTKIEDKSDIIEKISQKYRDKFLNDNDSPTYMDKLYKASAWYAVTYEEAKKSNTGENNPAISFPWNVCDDWLNRIKTDYSKYKNHKRLSITISDDILKKIKLK